MFPDQPRQPVPQQPKYLEAGGYRLWVNPPGGFEQVKAKYDKEGNKVGETVVRLTNFGALITAEVTVDDGAEVRREFEIKASVHGHKASFRVPADRFAGMSWVTEHLGAQAIVQAGMGLKDHARAAIQHISGDKIAQHYVYAHTGWRELPGGHGYLTASGAMMSGGINEAITVDLGPLSGYALPDVPDLPALQQAIRASLSILSVAPDQVTVPLLGTVYRAPVPLPSDCSAWLHGQTGTFKTAMCALAQQHFGAGMGEGALPGNWTSTANALEMQAFTLDGVVFVIDDYSPPTSRYEASQRASAADRVLRGVANHSARGRLRSDSSYRPPKPSRAQVLTSAEDIPPGGASEIARTMICEVSPGMVSLQALSAAQDCAEDGILSAAMAGYTRDLARALDSDPGLRTGLRRNLFELRDTARRQGHPRTALNIATLMLGWLEFLDFAQRTGAISEAERRQLHNRVWAALCAVGDAQVRYARSTDPVTVYLQALAALISSGRAHLDMASLTGGSAPPGHTRWGWQAKETKDDTFLVPQGDLIGWTDGENVYLDPDTSHKAAVQFAEASGSPVGQTKHAVHKALAEHGLLASYYTGSFTTKRDLGGKTGRRVLHLTVNGFDSTTELLGGCNCATRETQEVREDTSA